MTRFSNLQKTNKIIVVFIGFYIITLMFVLMMFSESIKTELLLGGFGTVAGVFTAIVAFIKYQGRKKK